MEPKEKPDPHKLQYSIEEVPPFAEAVFLGFQHYLTMLGATVSMAFLICPALCIEDDDPARGNILSTLFFVSGIVTFLQSTFGCRLPIVQGGTFTFLAPTFAILALPEFQCPQGFDQDGWPDNVTEAQKTEEWQIRMRAIQGAICVASIFQLVIGYTGIIGLMLKYITPLTIAPSVTMIGLSLFHSANSAASTNWAVSISTILVMVLFSQYLKDVPLPCLAYRQDEGVVKKKFYMIRLFPVLLTITMMWLVCTILTVTDALPEGDPGRVDTNLDLLKNAKWFRVPYPFQWGWPTVTVAGVFGMLAGVLASAIESIGDYYACARLSGAPPPPTHAINRGIGTEGLGCIIAGMFGTGNGTTSYSENIGAIGVTKVGSRRVIQYGAIIMIIVGCITKFGAFFLTIPQPIVGGVFCIMFGIIGAVGLSNLQFVDLNSTRNLFVLGFSMFMALVIPQWVEEHAYTINTGNEIVDQIFFVMLTTSMFVAGLLGFILDNTIPGTNEERGVTAWRSQGTEGEFNSNDQRLTAYDIPFITKYLLRWRWARYVPFFPTFQETDKNLTLPQTEVDNL